MSGTDFLKFMGNTFGGLWSTMAANASSFKQYKYQKQLQAHAAQLNYDYSKKYNQYSLLNNPTYTRQGYESAGFNPMLAVQNGTSGASASSFTSAGSAVAPDNVGALSSGIANAQAVQRLKNETMTAESQTNLNNEQAKTEGSKRENLSFQNAMLDVEKHLKQKDLDTYDRRFYSEMYEQMQRAENYRAMASLQGYNAETARISANANKLTSETGAKWTPYGIASGLVGGAIGAGIGAYGGIRGASILKDIPKRLPLGKRR